MKKSRKMFIFIILCIFIVICIPTFTKARVTGPSYLELESGATPQPIEDEDSQDVTEHPSFFKPNEEDTGDAGPITEKANKVIGALTTVGVVVSAITIMVLGIKYVMGSVAEKADYKKSMAPYLVGAVFLLSTSVIVQVVASLVVNTSLTDKVL